MSRIAQPQRLREIGSITLERLWVPQDMPVVTQLDSHDDFAEVTLEVFGIVVASDVMAPHRDGAAIQAHFVEVLRGLFPDNDPYPKEEFAHDMRALNDLRGRY